MHSFSSFLDRKSRESIKQLKIVEKVLKKEGFQVLDYLESNEDDPYIFCYNPQKNTMFEGIRIYKLGDCMAFRIQRQSQTHPYGKAYPLNLDEMFNDFLSDEGADEEKAGHLVIETLGKEIKKFFIKSGLAEKEERTRDIDNHDSAGSVMIQNAINGYGSLVNTKV